MLRTESIVNGHFTKLILQDADLPFTLFFENVVYKGCLAGSQKASNDSDWSQFLLFAHGLFVGFFVYYGTGGTGVVARVS